MYRYSQATKDLAQDRRTVIIDHRGRQETQQGPERMKIAEEAYTEEEVLLIPVEDITRISFKTETKKGLEADVETEVIREYEPTENRFDRCGACLCRCCSTVFSCCSQLTKCCECGNVQVHVDPVVNNTVIIETVAASKRNRIGGVKDIPMDLPKESCCSIFDCIRCWCCRRQRLNRIFRRTKTVAEEKAQRAVTMILEYGQYTVLDTTSNARVPNGEPQAIHGKQQFATTRLEFYLLTNTDYDSRNFEQQKHQAEILCRTVMHIKGMRSHYPTGAELDNILGQSHETVFGNMSKEPVLQLEEDLNAAEETPQIQESPAQPAVEQRKTTAS